MQLQELNQIETQKQLLTKELSKYQDLVVTSENEKETKDLRIQLNKDMNALDTERKAVEKKVKEKYGELTTLYKGTINAIDTKLDELDQVRKHEKLELIIAYYLTLNCTEPYDKFHNEKWLNKTHENWQAELYMAVNQYKESLKVVIEPTAVINQYKESLVPKAEIITLDPNTATPFKLEELGNLIIKVEPITEHQTSAILEICKALNIKYEVISK